MYGCNSMLEWCGLSSGVKLSIKFNFRLRFNKIQFEYEIQFHLVSFEGSSRGFV